MVNAWPVEEIHDQLNTNSPDTPEQVQKAFDKEELWLLPDGRIQVTTLEGTHIMNADDMLIEGVEGEFYGCKPAIFAKTYERVEDSE